MTCHLADNDARVGRSAASRLDHWMFLLIEIPIVLGNPSVQEWLPFGNSPTATGTFEASDIPIDILSG
ncbi:hypothetical protein WG66_009475 [Moniliophthora roreri]|nr:hypothetical protein WG66_009475 [Moniliophthora roreri]